MTTSVVPLIDLAPFVEGTAAGKRAVAAQVGRACEEIGFLKIVGHGVPAALVEAMDAHARAFFALPLGRPAGAPKYPPVTSGEHRLRKFPATSLEPTATPG